MVIKDGITDKDIMEYLIDDIADEYKISTGEAKRRLYDALTYNIVIASIKEQIDYLMEEEEYA